jgi:predicted transcriptional regulator
VNERRDETLTVTLRAPSSLIRRVDAIARRDGVTRSVVIRQAVASGLIAGPRPGFLQSADADAVGAAS